MIRKLLIAGASVALAASGLVAVTAVASSGVAGAAATSTITCAETGTVTFTSPGLSFGGALSSSTSVKTTASIAPTGTDCPTAPIGVSIPSATTLCPETGGVPNGSDPSACLASKTKDNVTTYSIASKPYYYDTTGSYETSGVANLQAALDGQAAQDHHRQHRSGAGLRHGHPDHARRRVRCDRCRVLPHRERPGEEPQRRHLHRHRVSEQ